MSQVEELLNSLSESIPEHTHPLVDDDSRFIINPDTKQITNAMGRKGKVLMQNEHNAETFTIEIPRYVDGHDMSLCNSVKVYYTNIETASGNSNEDTHDAEDLQVDPNNEESVVFSWTIRREATQLVGILSFIVHYTCWEDGICVYEFYSDYYSDITVKKTKNNGPGSVIQYSDILEQWRSRLFNKSVEAIEQTTSTTEPGGLNVLTITQGDGTKTTFNVYNGIEGPKGDAGDKGDKGDKGDTGETGPRGEIGMQGPKGNIGPQGEVGPRGETGPKGEQGPVGDQGPAGVDGESGVYYGTEEPTAENHPVWINPNGTPYVYELSYEEKSEIANSVLETLTTELESIIDESGVL